MIIDALASLDINTVAVSLVAIVATAHLLPWLWDPHGIRLYPGPLIAKFSDAWLGWVSAQGHRSEVVHEMHKKYGPFVRLAPNHVSIAEPDALPIVYAHGNGALKSDFYDAFVSIQRGIFNTRSRVDHARKRKIVSHVFSQKSVTEFEPHIRHYVGLLINKWDQMYDSALKGGSGAEGESGWHGADGRLWLDCLPWANYLAFDIVGESLLLMVISIRWLDLRTIGDLAFGAPFGMIQAGQDSAPVPKSQKAVMDSYGKNSENADVKYIPAVKILNGRGEYSMSMGALPWYWRPIARRLPWYSKGQKDVQALAGIAIMAVAKRLATPTDRNDLLSKLQAGKDEDGNPMGRAELTAEALTLLIAGSDTTSNSTCAIIYYLASNPDVQAKLHQELDEQLGTEDELVSNADQVKRLPYLDAVINESLRLHSTSALGLPRVVPEGGLAVMGQFFPEGTVLSVPSYTIHRNARVWGEDVETFRPERWFEGDNAAMQKTINIFSYGPRACVGRNLATLELQIIVSSILRRYHFVLENPDQMLETREGFLRKPVECRVGVKRRETL